ncbi:paraquat-inducible protein A [Vibrio quintilis]|uniref:Paraquat-inducible protein A n=1 Tax=Vibrio quintilis TaxID=1117707 RepID=A0A1M7YVZ7_9VIBR|nr:paraquat-inducible protein A [Vibrio quintilis]SHO56784.1 Paraquat-inducible protein A [Vibrio quintilis]
MTAERISPPLIACQECGIVVEATEIQEGQKLICPRCHHRLTYKVIQPSQRVVAYSISCLIMLILSISFPFMSFSVRGLSQEITLFHAVEMLDQFKYFLIAFVLLATVIVLPAIYVGLILYLYLKAGRSSTHAYSDCQRRRIRLICRILFRVEPWLMVDVFLIGVLVSLVKISSLADIGLGSSFWAFCVYSVLVVKCVSLIDRFWLWNQFIPPETVEQVKAGDTHLDGNHTSCAVCHQINPESGVKHARCIRCGSLLHPYHPDLNLQRSWALLVTSVIFYIPANLYPMMNTVSFGSNTPTTIMEGILLLWKMGSYPVAVVIFIASMFIPLAKMFILAWLFLSAKKAQVLPEKEVMQRMRIYRMTEFIGRWSMVDIFVVSLMAALVQLQNLMAVYPGPAAVSFSIVVIFTMLSAMVFDPRDLWQNHHPVKKEEQSVTPDSGHLNGVIDNER